MALAILEPLVRGACRAQAADGSTTAAGFWRKGVIASVGAPAASVYTVTTTEPINLSEVIIDAITIGSNRKPVVTILTATTFSVATFNSAGAAADLDFTAEITEYRTGP